MPLYMDLHKGLEDISIPELKKGHSADLKVENKYGIKYLKYFFNQKAGTVFCVIWAPSKEACEAAHREAIGFTACSIIEVNPGDYDLFMGKVEEDETGLAQYLIGSLDSGNRIVLYIDLICNPIHLGSPKYLKSASYPNKIIRRAFKIFGCIPFFRFRRLFSLGTQRAYPIDYSFSNFSN